MKIQKDPVILKAKSVYYLSLYRKKLPISDGDQWF